MEDVTLFGKTLEYWTHVALRMECIGARLLRVKEEGQCANHPEIVKELDEDLDALVTALSLVHMAIRNTFGVEASKNAMIINRDRTSGMPVQ